MPNVARIIGRDCADDPINRDIAAGRSDQDIISAHLAREEANYNKKGLPFTRETKNREWRKVTQRLRDKKIKNIDVFGAENYCPFFLPYTIPSERGPAPTDVLEGIFIMLDLQSVQAKIVLIRNDTMRFTGIPVCFTCASPYRERVMTALSDILRPEFDNTALPDFPKKPVWQAAAK